MRKILRVFPRRTHATPTDENVRIDCGPLLWDVADECDEVHVSVAFTWDLPRAEQLAREWNVFAPGKVKIGGPATEERAGEFEPGMYLKQGYTITSRGCPNKCWYCHAWKRDGNVRELRIRDGWIVQDDNLLACSDAHVKTVFEMLRRQKHRAKFSGGLEAARISKWIARELAALNPEQLFVAYDMPDDLDAVVEAGKALREAGYKRHGMRCYVLCGWKADTIEAAERRMLQAVDAGFIPAAMLLFDQAKQNQQSEEWKWFHKLWARPASIAAYLKSIGHKSRALAPLALRGAEAENSRLQIADSKG